MSILDTFILTLTLGTLAGIKLAKANKAGRRRGWWV